MKNKKQKIIVILGPTASGKSDFAVTVAKKFNGEVISADSRQVYKQLNIGTGKITKKEMKGVPHHLLDVIDPKKTFTVSDFKKLADKTIGEIASRGKLPIICGGTGFYIDAVVKNILLPEVPPNIPLRKKYEKWDTLRLFKTLQKLDAKRAKEIDPKNKVRIIRAIEIAEALGKVPKLKSKPVYEAFTFGISWTKAELDQRIYKRLLSRIKTGMIEEAKGLHKKGLTWKRMEELGLEYRYLARYLQEKISKEEMIEKLHTEIKQYAKRQTTWFKRDSQIVWLQHKELKKAPSLITHFLRS